jgi:hypothetical protein
MSDAQVIPLAEVVAAISAQLAAAPSTGFAADSAEVELAVEVARGSSGDVEVGVVVGHLPVRHKVTFTLHRPSDLEAPTAPAVVEVAAPGEPAPREAAPAVGVEPRAGTEADELVMTLVRLDSPQRAGATASALRHGTAQSLRWSPPSSVGFATGSSTLVDPAAAVAFYRAAGGGQRVMFAGVLGSDMVLAGARVEAVVAALAPAVALDGSFAIAPLFAPPPASGGAQVFLLTV